MSVRQKKAREAALWALYGMDITGELVSGSVDGFYPIARELDETVSDLWEQVEGRVEGVVAEMPRVDREIQRVSQRWRLERMAVIDRNILRVGAWELLVADTLPIVVINACVELAKDYGEEDTPGFVNGLLDQICKDNDIQISPEA